MISERKKLKQLKHQMRESAKVAMQFPARTVISKMVEMSMVNLRYNGRYPKTGELPDNLFLRSTSPVRTQVASMMRMRQSQMACNLDQRWVHGCDL